MKTLHKITKVFIFTILVLWLLGKILIKKSMMDM